MRDADSRTATAFVEARFVEDQAPPARGGVIVLELREGGEAEHRGRSGGARGCREKQQPTI